MELGIHTVESDPQTDCVGLGGFLNAEGILELDAAIMDGDTMIALIVFMVLDYITGLMCAIADKKLSSAVGFRGICKKVLILMLVGVAHIVDLHVVGTGDALRSAVVCFYLSNESVSMLENAAHLGLPIPEKLKSVLAQLHGREDETESKEDVQE